MKKLYAMRIGCDRIILTVLLIPLAFAFSGSKTKMKKVELIDGIHARVPAEFYEMGEQDILERYMLYKMPLAMYSSQDRLAEFGLSISDNFWEGNDLELLGEFQQSNLNYLYDKIKIEKQGVREIHKHKVYYFEFTSATRFSNAYEKKYTIVQYMIIQNRILVFNFSCPQFDRDKYQDAAWGIMNSIKVKSNPF